MEKTPNVYPYFTTYIIADFEDYEEKPIVRHVHFVR